MNLNTLFRFPKEERSIDLLNWEGAPGGTASGTSVNEQKAFKFSVAYAAMTLIADGVASLPPEAFTEAEDGTREPAKLPQWIRKPHAEIRRFDIWNQLLLSMLAWGNGYAQFIRRPSDGVITGLNVLDPSKVVCEWDPTRPGARRYRVNPSNRWLTANDIMHVQGPTLPGEPKGMSVIRQAREAIGLGLTLEEFGARYFSQGSQAKIVIELPGTKAADDKTAMGIIKMFERFHRGKGNWHRPALLSGGAKLHNITIPPDDAQFLESRKWQAVDVARWFRVPPHRVGIVDASTSWGSGLAEENMAMLQHTYRPWIIRLEGALTAYAPGGEDSGMIIRLDTATLLRGTFKEQADVFGLLYELQVLTKNETRHALGYSKVDGGDDFYSGASAANPRTKEQDRVRKQDEAARSLPKALGVVATQDPRSLDL
jgi:HK97 family phage portal protein